MPDKHVNSAEVSSAKIRIAKDIRTNVLNEHVVDLSPKIVQKSDSTLSYKDRVINFCNDYILALIAVSSAIGLTIWLIWSLINLLHDIEWL